MFVLVILFCMFKRRQKRGWSFIYLWVAKDIIIDDERYIFGMSKI